VPEREPEGVLAALGVSSGPTVDDRGAPFKLLSAKDLKKAEEDPNNRRRLLARHLKQALKAETKRFTWTRLVIGVGVVVGLMLSSWAFQVGAIALKADPLVTRLGGSAVFWGGVVMFVVVAHAVYRRNAARKLAVTAVAEGVCGACAYSLEGISPEADGCLPCPECGAAWRAARVVRPHWAQGEVYEPFDVPWWRRLLTGTPRSRDQLSPDDRGRFVRVIDSHLKLLDPAMREQFSPEFWERVRRDARRVGRIPRVLVALIPGAFGLLALFGVVSMLLSQNRLTSGDLIAGSVGGGFGLFLLFMSYVIVRSYNFGGPAFIAPVLRSHGLCAACGQTTDGLAPAADGFVTCPRCGSGWVPMDRE
jgi:hypothetical protein